MPIDGGFAGALPPFINVIIDFSSIDCADPARWLCSVHRKK
jgi:hypothetical protein